MVSGCGGEPGRSLEPTNDIIDRSEALCSPECIYERSPGTLNLALCNERLRNDPLTLRDENLEFASTCDRQALDRPVVSGLILAEGQRNLRPVE